MFNEGLQDSTSIVFVAQLLVLVANQINALLDQSVFLFIADFFLFHEESIVVNLLRLVNDFDLLLVSWLNQRPFVFVYD